MARRAKKKTLDRVKLFLYSNTRYTVLSSTGVESPWVELRGVLFFCIRTQLNPFCQSCGRTGRKGSVQKSFRTVPHDATVLHFASATTTFNQALFLYLTYCGWRTSRPAEHPFSDRLARETKHSGEPPTPRFVLRDLISFFLSISQWLLFN